MGANKLSDEETMTSDVESGTPNEYTPLKKSTTFFKKNNNLPNCTFIDIHNDRSGTVILLDISSNKEWMTYLTQANDQPSSQEPKIYLTRCRFIATNEDENGDEINFQENKIQSTSNKKGNFRVDISTYIRPAGSNHCKFLSISHDGRHIALSFFERNPQGGSQIKEPKNDSCHIFEANDSGIELKETKKCNGRAVFMKKGYPSLALVDENQFKCEKLGYSVSRNNTFDLNIFKSETTMESTAFHNSYIENAPWLDFHGENDDIKKMITLTRHIRHNIIITPFRASGIVRAWSIMENGACLTSFIAKDQHIMAFSKDFKFTAAYVGSNNSINIYNVKSGLLVYRLESQIIRPNSDFEVSHIRFCYGGRYVAMSGWEGNNVVFEIWYLEAEKSIYRVCRDIGARLIYDKKDTEIKLKVFEPFVTRGYNLKNEKCLIGLYMSYIDNQLKTNFLELRIDAKNSDLINWCDKDEEDAENSEQSKNKKPCYNDEHEIVNSLEKFDKLKCGYIEIKEKKYLIRFGKRTIQLWLESSETSKTDYIRETDELLYIRAYKGPNYGHSYSFCDTWRICNFDSIRCVGKNPLGRLIVNIRDLSGEDEDKVNSKSYHTEEIFLPLDELSQSNSSETKFDYHKFESACQALHYFYSQKSYDAERNMGILRTKTLALIKSGVSSITSESNYFSTLAGSRTLAMLASFKEGRDIIKLIVKKQDVTISIFSYHRPLFKINESLTEETKKAIECYSKLKAKFKLNKPDVSRTNENTNNRSPNDVFGNNIRYRNSPEEIDLLEDNYIDVLATNENILTILIEELEYNLFKLFFNRILLDSKKVGPGCLSALTDALVFLQEEGNSDILLSSSQKLSFLKIDCAKLGILDSELYHVVKMKSPQKDCVANLRDLEPHAIIEQLEKVSIYKRHLLKFKAKFGIKVMETISCNIMLILTYFKWKYSTKHSQEPKKMSNLCVIPLPHFNSYSYFPEDRPKNEIYDDASVLPYKLVSAFTRIASHQNINNIFQQGDTILEVLLEYKWKAFARNKFILICFIHMLYYVSYSTGVLFSRALFVRDSDNTFDMMNPGHIASLIIMGISLAVLSIQEFRQFLITRDKISYVLSGYNWVDVAAFGFSIYTVLQSLLGWDYFSEVCSVTTLILWTHAILRLRVISYFGITLEIIIQLFKKIFSVLFIMLLVIIAFTQAFIVLLQSKDDKYFQDNFEGGFTSDTTLGAGIVTTEGLVELANVSGDNGFSDWFKAFSQVWFFIYGVWDPVIEGDAGDDKMIMALCILFSFVMVLIFFNMVIALMSSTVEQVQKRGKKAWVSHFAAVVSEIELLWCFESERHSRKNNPTYIYYIANAETILIYENKLRDETEELLQKI